MFDTGDNNETLLYNMKKLGIEPKDIDIVFMSHMHWDHTGGLGGVLKGNPNITVYLPVSFPFSFKDRIKSYDSKVVEVGGAEKIPEGVWTTGELGTVIKEQSFMVMTSNGLVVVTGCSHPGIVEILKETKRLTNKSVYIVIGGFHLMGSSEPEIKDIIGAFREMGVEKVAPCHCSGVLTRRLFKEEYGDDFIENGVGKVING